MLIELYDLERAYNYAVMLCSYNKTIPSPAMSTLRSVYPRHAFMWSTCEVEKLLRMNKSRFSNLAHMVVKMKRSPNSILAKLYNEGRLTCDDDYYPSEIGVKYYRKGKLYGIWNEFNVRTINNG